MALRNLVDKALVRLIRDHAGSRFLRDRFRKLYDIEIGAYSFGAFDRWRIPPGTRIGRYCSIAGSAQIVSANHPMGSLSTHPLFYLKSGGLVGADQVHSAPTVVEDDVWLGHNCIITPKCRRIGRGAVIGAGAVVARDVPPYAIMVGTPARVARYRFAPELIAAIEATRWWELDRDQIAAASRNAPGFLTEPTIAGARAFIEALGRPVPEDFGTPAAHA